MVFTWDDEKNAQNIKKHHLSFELAVRVFLDPNAVTLYDKKHSKTEDRYIIIGFITPNFPVFTVYTLIGEDTYRIVSARKATKSEVAFYFSKWG